MHEIELKSLPQRYAAVVKFRAAAAEMGSRMPQAFGEAMAFLMGQGIQAGAPAFARYRRAGEAFDVEAGFYVPEAFAAGETVQLLELPAVEAVVAVHIGSYETLPAVYEAIDGWAGSQGRELAEDMYEEYWTDPQATPPSEWRTTVIWPLKPAG